MEIRRVRAEPFAPAVLDHLESILARLASEVDRIGAAAVLHRYGRMAGTAYLRKALEDNPGSPAVLPAATALAMARDSESVEVIRNAMVFHVTESEFARAVGAWAHPDLIGRARELLEDGSVPRGAVLLLLAMARSKEAGPGLASLGIPDSGAGPAVTPFHAAMARVGDRDPGPVVESLRRNLARPDLSVGWWTQCARLVGPEAALPVVQQAIEQYAESRQAFGEAYDAHARGVRDGTRSIADLPPYPTTAEHRLLEVMDLVREWKEVSAVDELARALEAAGEGRYSLLLNRELIAAILHLDPGQGPERLRGMGVTERELALAERLNQLQPLPNSLMPEQRSIALTRPTQPETGN